MTVTITHTHADGTLVYGTSKGDGVYEVLRPLRWRWMPSIRKIGIQGSRYKPAQRGRIEAARRALEAAGFDVTAEIDDSGSFAEDEAARYEAAEDRAARQASRAQGAAARSAALSRQAHQMGEAIPFGQPMLTDHYSYRRDVNYRRRMQRTHERSWEEADKAAHHERSAASAGSYQASRENIPRTMRRLDKLRADLRRAERAITGRLDYAAQDGGGYKLELVKPGPKYAAQLEAQAVGLREQIAYWEGHVQAAEAAGVKVWGPADFAKGDYVCGRWGWAEVLRVNPKSVTIPWGVNAVHLPVVTRDNVRDAMGGGGWTDKVTYDDVRGRKSAADMKEAS